MPMVMIAMVTIAQKNKCGYKMPAPDMPEFYLRMSSRYSWTLVHSGGDGGYTPGGIRGRTESTHNQPAFWKSSHI